MTNSGFSAMKARITRLEAGQETINAVKPSYATDDRYWTPTADKDGNAKAILRFLPAPDGESHDVVTYWSHYITGMANKKYVERCRSSLNEADPAQELAVRAGALDKKAYSGFGRSIQYIANVLVIADPAKPENNGKVFLFRFGNKLWEKAQQTIKGSDDPIDPKDPINVFCPWTGANLKLILKKKGGFNNYDDSVFLSPSALFNGDEAKIEEVWKQEHSLKGEIAPDKFKSYDELYRLLVSVVGNPDSIIANLANQATGTSKPAANGNGNGSAKKPTKAAPVETEDDDPEAVFNDLMKETEPLSSDALVEELFRD
jgi:hypothetical protein